MGSHCSLSGSNGATSCGRSRARASKSEVPTAKSQSEKTSCVPRDREPANSTLVTAGWSATSSVATETQSSTTPSCPQLTRAVPALGRRRSPPATRPSAQGCPQTGRVDPPVVVLLAVDEGHRDLVPEPALERVIAVDGDLVVGLPQLRADRLDGRASVIAQVAPRARIEGDAGGHSRRPKDRRRSMPRRRPFCT